jgi:hypothetical protein
VGSAAIVESLLAADNMGAGLFLYVPMFIYSWFFDAWLPLIGQKFEFVDKVTLRVYIRPEAR